MGSWHDASNGGKVNNTPVVRVGIIGCGEITQVSHIHTLNYLSDLFKITYLCDVSLEALRHCAPKVHGTKPRTTTSAFELCEAPDVDAVLIANATAFHAPHAVLALQNNKHVLLEKPAALNYESLNAVVAAEKLSMGKVFVGYMRRYAPAFKQALQEIGDKANIQYARVRDIIGPNSTFVDQSGTFPKKFTDISESDANELKERNEIMVKKALNDEFGLSVSKESALMLQILGGLGSHDLSAMREILGMPKGVHGSRLTYPFWTAIFDYGTFPVVYESGLHGIPIFDAHIEVYTETKSIKIKYDTPYIKGLPTTMTIREKITGSSGEISYEERYIRPTFEDSYTVEFKEWHDCIVTNRQPKTGIADAGKDIDIFKMLLRSHFAPDTAP